MNGTTFGPYRVEGLLGRGGMGEVYRAHDASTDRAVALKVLPAHLAEDPEYRTRFERECRAVARLSEPHVVPIHRFGDVDGRLYLDMRLVEGTDLASWLREHGPLPPAAAVAVVSQVAAALDAAHAVGLVHRDVKPSNVLLAGVQGPHVDREVFAYLVDFGIARGADDAALTSAGTMPGTPAYAAPERFSGLAGDPRSDVYALTCVLHEALTGHPPFEGELVSLMGAHLSAPPPRPTSSVPDLPAGLDGVVAGGMAKDPRQRIPTPGALAAAARAAVGLHTDPTLPRPGAGAPVVPTPGATAYAPAGYAPPPGPVPPGHPPYDGWPPVGQPPPAPPPSRRGHRVALVVAAVVGVIALLAGGLALALTRLGSPLTPPPAVAAPPPAPSSTPVTSPSPGAFPPSSTPPSPTPTSPSTAQPALPEPAPAPSDPVTDLLLAELPAGYGPANCVPTQIVGSVATALVDCAAPPTVGTGPSDATFARYASVADLDVEFDIYAVGAGIDTPTGDVTACATTTTARAIYSRQNGGLGGQVACFTETSTGVAFLIWTDDAALALGYLSSATGDATALYDWWQSIDFRAQR